MKKSKKLFLFGKLRDFSTSKYEVEVGKVKGLYRSKRR